MDYYKVLGLDKSATKPEIKDAFRKLAMKFHPDKHTASSKSIKDTATLKFKQLSEAYDVLSDDRKRSDYNNLRHSGSEFGSSSRATGSGYGYGYSSRTSSSSSSDTNYNSNGYGSRNNTYNNNDKYYYTSYTRRASYANNGFAYKFGVLARYLTTSEFLLHAAFVSVIIGGAIIIEGSRNVLWKLQNSGKSFEDAIDNIEKAKTEKDTE